MAGRKEVELGSEGERVTPLGIALRTWRRHRNLSVSQLAEKTGIGKGYLSQVEHGRIKRLGDEYLNRIVGVLSISPDDLLRPKALPDVQVTSVQLASPSEVGGARNSERKRNQKSEAQIQHILEAIEALPQRLAEILEAKLRYLQVGESEAGQSPLSSRGDESAHAKDRPYTANVAEPLRLREGTFDMKEITAAVERLLEHQEHLSSNSSSGDDQTNDPVGKSQTERAAELTEVSRQQLVELLQIAKTLGLGLEAFNSKLKELIPTEERDVGQATPPSSEDGEPPGKEDITESLLYRVTSNRPASTLPSLSGLPPQDVKIRGEEKVLHYAIKLIEEAQDLPEGGQILVNFQREQDIFASFAELRCEWWQKLRACLERGWDIIYLNRLTTDRTQVCQLILTDMFELLGRKGNFEPFYFPPGSPVRRHRDFLIVPGKGALEFAPSQKHRIDTAFFTHPDSSIFISSLDEQFRKLQGQCLPLLRPYPGPRVSLAFDNAVKDHIKKEGDRFVFMDGLSEVTAPAEIHWERARPIFDKGGSEAELARELLENRRVRELEFQRQIKQEKYLFRDICPMSAIERLVNHGITASDDRLVYLGGSAETLEQRRLHLQNVISLLRSSPRYELGLIDNKEMNGPPTFWLVKGERVVFLETWPSNTQSIEDQLDLEITEPTVVSAFHDLFLKLWEQPSTIKDKEKVISWLEYQMTLIPQRIIRGS